MKNSFVNLPKPEIFENIQFSVWLAEVAPNCLFSCSIQLSDWHLVLKNRTLDIFKSCYFKFTVSGF